MILTINDDFDLNKIAHCGQCFRAKEILSGIYRFITDKHVIYINRIDDAHVDAACSEIDWLNIWRRYFDLETDYREIRHAVNDIDPFLKTAADYGLGIRVLRQAPFETLISFIISQRKSIPSITTSVERIAAKFGSAVETQYETVHLFPTIDQLSDVTIDDLTGLGLGYRKGYILDAIDKIKSGAIDLDDLYNVNDETLTTTLKTIRGVGDKVANCVALFAYHRVDRVPIDVWIKRAIDEDFGGHNIFDEIGKNAGIVQQYVFYYKKYH